VKPLLVVVIASLAACSDDDASPHRPGPRHRDAQRAVDRCIAAVDSLASVPAQGPMMVLSRGCHDVFVASACRSAFRRLPEVPPEARASTLANACAEAYCGDLGPPRPALCTIDSTRELPPSTLMEHWPELMRAINRHDLGIRQANRLADVMDVLHGPLTPVVRGPLGPRAPPPPPHRLTLSRSPDGLSARLLAPDGTELGRFALPEDPQADDVHALAGALARPETANVQLSAEPDVEYSAVVAVLDGLQRRGVAQFSIAPFEPDTPRP
jgi:hypothetical protein